MARIAFRTTKPGLKVADPDEALKWCDEYERAEFIRTKTVRSLDVTAYKNAAASVLATDGEMLPGIEQTPESTSMSITFKEK